MSSLFSERLRRRLLERATHHARVAVRESRALPIITQATPRTGSRSASLELTRS